MYIERVVLRNIRCFSKIEVGFDLAGGAPPCAIIVGDNAAGKTTLLRSIAIGLCDESSAAGLLKESDTGYVKYGEDQGEIVISLTDSKGRYEIRTTIQHIKTARGSFERVRQETTENFPWDSLFVAGYGAGRGTSGSGDIAGYSVVNAVYNMFNYTEGLQNPELTILRLQGCRTQEEIQRALRDLLKVDKIECKKSGITVDGIWGTEMPLRDLADGYKSTFLWVTDMLGWAFSFNKSIGSTAEIEGIVIIDELEQHLHATWQRVIVDRLREAFPRVQFIAATHSPLVAASIGPLVPRGVNDKLILCEVSQEAGEVRVEELPTMQRYRFEQVLASRAFKYLCEANPALEGSVKRASELADKGVGRSQEEEQEYQRLKDQLKGTPFLWGDTPIEREMQAEKLAELKRENDLSEKHNDQDRTA